jgi:hypothetical protein
VRPLRKPLAAALALLLPLAPAAAQDERPQVGLFTTLPIYWYESEGLSELIAPDAEPHWARSQIEQRFELVPLDVLSGEGARLNGVGNLLLAQPRMLSPAENVGLDAWVRDGGRLLLFADPMLTGESIFELGDKRRPQDVALLSPILAHWGLELLFDESQPAGERLTDVAGFALPINAAGRFRHFPADEPRTACNPRAGGLIAECAIGRGRAVIVADAALFDGAGDAPERRQALAALLEWAFGDR